MMNILNWDKVIPDDMKLKFENDNPYTFQHPCYALLIAKSGGGKTNLLMSLLMQNDVKMNIDKVYIICKDDTEDKYKFIKKYYRDLEEKIRKKTKTSIELLSISTNINEIPELNKMDKTLQNVIVFDDLVLEKNQHKIIEYYIRARKLNISCIYLTQSFFKVPKTIRDNTQYFVIFNIPNRREIINMHSTFAIDIDDQKTFRKMIRESTKNKNNFFLIDLKTITPELRYRKGFKELWQLPKMDEEDTGNKELKLVPI